MKRLSLLIFCFLLLACSQEVPTPTSPPIAIAPTSDAALPPTRDPAEPYPAPAYPVEGDQSAGMPRNSNWPLFTEKILFHSGRVGAQISLFGLDGTTGETLQLVLPTVAFEPTYSPDCSQIAFTGQGAGENYAIYVSGADARDPKIIVRPTDGSAYNASWSPDGSKIAYALLQNATINVCTVNPDGSDQVCMAGGNGNNANPVFSADSTQLLFTSNRDGDWDIYSTPVSDLNSPRLLTNNDYNDLRPAVSADNIVVFDGSPLGQYDIYTMNIDGSNMQQLTTDPADDTSADWVSNQIVFFQFAFGRWRPLPNKQRRQWSHPPHR